MVRERRRYFRYPVELEVILRFGQNHEIRARTTNVSEGGMAIRAVAPLSQGVSAKLSLSLPDSRGPWKPKPNWFGWMATAAPGSASQECLRTSGELLDQWLEEEILRVIHFLMRNVSPIEGRIQLETCGEPF